MHRLSLLPLALLAGCGPAPAPDSPVTIAPAAEPPPSHAPARASASGQAALSPDVLFPLTKEGGRTRNDPAPASSEVLTDPLAPRWKLPPEVIQKIVRQSFGTFRLCYENGLRRDANLQGRVTVYFVIGRDGKVTQTSNRGSDLPDEEVVRCVVEAFRPLVFPPPDGGIVTVVYPISFAPGG
ncbi:MAG: AgmX/PglI C-terminal domain-containing protein [Myxococcales bacterium]|nr:MAG: AgmX/PglI C-terminal domain-containing protein [Myxococcales bacterium]